LKTYLVTGGAGFIGANFVRLLLAERADARVVNLDKLTYAGNLENLAEVMADPRHRFVRADICDAAAVAAVFATEPVDCVVNFAAESHVDRSLQDAAPFARTNVQGALTLLEAARGAWAQGGGYRPGVKFLQVSTDEVYGSLGETGLFTESTPLAPRSPYSASKAAADLFALAFAETYGLPVNITRCSNNYGPYQFPEKLIPLMIRNALAHRPLPVYGDGRNVRDWLHVEDHCRALLLTLERGVPGEVYNIGGHNERANIDIVRTLIACLGEHDPAIDEGLICYVQDRKGHDRRYAIDAGKIEGRLGWKPRVPFEQGIRRTVQWYLQHADWLGRV
jgi:dTDP-glucose 4,6-dehydratase